MSFERTIVIDIDDTICYTLDRDFTNAIPIQPVIDKINDFHSKGWIIEICTARGNLSCSSREEADTRYRPSIETWLKDHNVNYHLLSFQKRLAAYYVDDKALRPDEFVDLDIEDLIGWSGDKVERRGNSVLKTQKDAILVCQWYKQVEDIISVPKIHSIVGNTITMEYIRKTSDEIDIETVLDLVETMKHLETNHNDFLTYVAYILNRLSVIPLSDKYKETISKRLANLDVCEMNNMSSFCHGDLSVQNIINKNGTHYLIDPSIKQYMWQSYILDIAKLSMSLRYNGLSSDLIYQRYDKDLVKLFEVTHLCRVYKDAPDKQKILDLIIDLLEGDTND